MPLCPPTRLFSGWCGQKTEAVELRLEQDPLFGWLSSGSRFSSDYSSVQEPRFQSSFFIQTRGLASWGEVFSLLSSCWYKTNVTRRSAHDTMIVSVPLSSCLALEQVVSLFSSLWSAEAAQPDCLPAERHHGKRRKAPPAAGDNKATSLPGMWRQGGADRKRKWSLLPPLQGGGVKGHGRVSGSHLSGRYHGDGKVGGITSSCVSVSANYVCLC